MYMLRSINVVNKKKRGIPSSALLLDVNCMYQLYALMLSAYTWSVHTGPQYCHYIVTRSCMALIRQSIKKHVIKTFFSDLIK